MVFRFTKDLFINNSLRKELSGLLGKMLRTQQLARSVGKDETIHAIGDVTVAALLKQGYSIKTAIFDYRTERSRTYFPIIKKTYRSPIKAVNKSGGLSR